MRVFALAILTLLVAACARAPAMDSRPAYCDQDNKICQDGSIVMRTGPDCEFVCPQEPKDACGYTSAQRDYWHHDVRECASAKPNCEPPWVQFSDECGCGCQRP